MTTFAKLAAAAAAAIASFVSVVDSSHAAWLSEQVAPAGSPNRSRLAFDREGTPHIAYLQPPVGFPFSRTPAGYARKVGGSWLVETVADTVAAAGFDIDVDADGDPAIAIASTVDAVNVSLATKTEAGWTIERADSDPVLAGFNDFGNRIELEFAPSGSPVLAYLEASLAKNVRVAVRSGGAWTIDVLEGVPGPSAYATLSLALTSDGQPVVAWSVSGVPSYAQKSAGSWSIEQLPFPGGVMGLSLAFDGEDVPHIALARGDSSWLSYATKTAGFWAIEVVDMDGVQFQQTSLDLERDGTVHIAYPVTSGVRHARRSGGTWTIEVADPGGTRPSLALDRGTYASREFPAMVSGSTVVVYSYPDPTPVGHAPIDEQAFLSASPNPALGGRLRVSYRVPGNTPFTLTIFDSAGRRVKRWSSGAGAPEGSVAWNGRDESGRAVASGAYFLRLEGERASATERVVLIR